MTAVAPAIENMTLNITEEILVRSSLAKTFAALLEITGPLMMSAPVVSNMQYRLKEVDGGTLITFRHTALGLIPDGFREGLAQGWTHMHAGVRRRAESA